MKSKIISLVFMLSMVLAVFPLQVSSSPVMGPGMDDYYAVKIADPYLQVAKLRADEIQACDVPEYSLVLELEAEGFYVHSFAASAFEYYDINVGGWKHYPEHGFPLNNTNFRRALAYLTNTETLIATEPLLKGLVVRNYAWIGHLAGGWYNDRPEGDPLAVEKFLYSPSNAIHEMFLGGFVPKDAGGSLLTEAAAKANPATINHWEYGGVPLRTIEVYACTSWPYYVSMAEAWRGGIEGIGIHTTTFYADWLTHWPAISRGDFDIGVEGTAWSRPDPCIMDFYFASWNQPQLPSNSPCCNWRFWVDAEADEWINTYSTTLNETLAMECAHKLQQKVAREAIMPAAFTWITYTAYNPNLMGFQRSGIGTDRSLAYFQTAWKTPESKAAHNNAYKVAWYELPEDLNPNLQISVAASWLLGAIIDGFGCGFGLTVLDPVTMQTRPWIAWKWKLETFTDVGATPGMKITYWLRKDVYWHDGVHFTADDVKFCLEYLRDHGQAAGQSKRATGNLRNVTVVDLDSDGWNEAVVYQNKASLFTLTYTSFWGAEIPKHIWEGVPDPTVVTPWTMDNPIPEAAARGLTWLVGTGPWEYHKGDWVPGEYIRFRANRNYYRNSEISLADINFNFLVDIYDAIKLSVNFGYVKGEPKYDIHYDINCDRSVDIYDAIMLSTKYGKPW